MVAAGKANKKVPPWPRVVISGGQTGVDRAALDAARAAGLPVGGAVPRGRRAEAGRVPPRYGAMTELASRRYRVRTRYNVAHADATLIILRGHPDPGTVRTRRAARRLQRPCLVVDCAAAPAERTAVRIRRWLRALRPRVLNVAGPRESSAPGIGAQAGALLALILSG